jgi:hypothetical protein
VAVWFAGENVYRQVDSAMYPPASYLMMWPLLGWTSEELARWLWAGLSVAALVWLAFLVVRWTRAEGLVERGFVVALVLGMHATGPNVGNGQLNLLLLGPLVLAMLGALRNDGDAWTAACAAAMATVALVKPSVAAPFFWILLLVPSRPWSAFATVLLYAGLTCFATAFQQTDAISLLSDWLERATAGAAWGAAQTPAAGGIAYGNVHALLGSAGLQEWNAAASLTLLGALGLWVWWRRGSERWILIGVAALVSRIWVYHRIYDDILILLPMIALHRIAKGVDGAPSRTAGALLGAAVVVTLIPARLQLQPPPWSTAYGLGQLMLWLAMLAFLLWRAGATPQTARSEVRFPRSAHG